jgi:hypothetical protein
MSAGNGSAYAEVTKKYLKGRIPFRVWSLSSFTGALVIVVNNLIQHHAILEGFFSVLFMNFLITIPIFMVQAHFVGLALQRNPKSAKKILVLVLLLAWTITGAIMAWFISKLYDEWNSGTWLMVWNFVTLAVMWWILSIAMFRVHK